jgi:hypothetical protein
LALSTAVLFAHSIRETVRCESHSREVASAETKTAYLEELTENALKANAIGAARCLEGVVHEYRLSDRRDEIGLSLDRMVERARSRATRDIIAHLRSMTERDLGDDPAPWIQEYAGQPYREEAKK